MLLARILIFLCSFLAFSISAISGGGAGLMLIPVLGALLPIAQVPATLSIGTFTSAASRLVAFRRDIAWHIVKYFVPAALPAVWLGAWLLKYINPLYLEIAMGLFLISNLSFLFRSQKELEETDKPYNTTLCAIGFSAGFLSGLTGAVGVIFNRFYLRYGLTKEEIIATRAANEIILHLVKIVLYSLFGLITTQVVSIGIIVAVAALFSTWFMKKILPMLSEVVFKKAGYFAMVLSGFLMLAQSGSSLLKSSGGNLFAMTQADELELKMKWQAAGYALEFGYDEGFEFEQEISFLSLSLEQQKMILDKQGDADKIIVEAVYGIRERSHEVYFFRENKLVDKIEFR